MEGEMDNDIVLELEMLIFTRSFTESLFCRRCSRSHDDAAAAVNDGLCHTCRQGTDDGGVPVTCGCAMPGDEATQGCAWETWRASHKRLHPEDPVVADDYDGPWHHRDFAGGDCRCSCHEWADELNGPILR